VEPSGPVQACNGIAFKHTYAFKLRCLVCDVCSQVAKTFQIGTSQMTITLTLTTVISLSCIEAQLT
jgi:hypothetical protein